jgi:pimeloyl-ACP methyl ester carboxylesterase
MPNSTQSNFEALYQRSVEKWPVPVESVSVYTEFGQTHLLQCGAWDKTALLLLPGGGATALCWAGIAGGLASSRRVLAADPPGQPGRSERSRPPRTVDELMSWLDQVIDFVGGPVDLAGHSYGAWIALRYALVRAGLVRSLALFDPTDCFAPLSVGYRLRAIPLIARPSAAGLRRLLAWETGGRSLDSDWLDVAATGAALGRMSIVRPQRPTPTQLASLRLPTTVIIAGRSRAHFPPTIEERARRQLPAARVVTLPSATHHTLPTEDVTESIAALADFP